MLLIHAGANAADPRTGDGTPQEDCVRRDCVKDVCKKRGENLTFFIP